MNFYKTQIPKENDIVFVRIRDDLIKSSDRGIYVDLVEYGNIEGFILCTEIRNKTKLNTTFKRDKIYPCMVLSIRDNNIDLSYSKVRKDDIPLLEEAYKSCNSIINLSKKIISEMNMNEEEANKFTENTVHRILRPEKYNECIVSGVNLFKVLYEELALDPNKIFGRGNSEYVENEKNSIIETINKMKHIGQIEVTKYFKLNVYSDNSLDTIKQIIRRARENLDNGKIRVECECSPVYKIIVYGMKLKEIENELSKVEENIKNIAKEYIHNLDFTRKYVITREMNITFN